MYALNCAWNSTILYVATWLMCLLGWPTFALLLGSARTSRREGTARSSWTPCEFASSLGRFFHLDMICIIENFVSLHILTLLYKIITVALFSSAKIDKLDI